MYKNYLPEREFIIRHIVNSFNFQYKRNIKPKDCKIFGIMPNTQYFKLGYEVVTLYQGVNLRLRFHANIRMHDICNPFKLETEGIASYGLLGDEVYVANGSFSSRWVSEKVYTFLQYPAKSISNIGFVIEESNVVLITEEGLSLIPE